MRSGNLLPKLTAALAFDEGTIAKLNTMANERHGIGTIGQTDREWLSTVLSDYARLAPIHAALIECVRALEVGNYYNAEINDLVANDGRKKVENHEEMLNELYERSTRMMREALTALERACGDKLESDTESNK